MLKAGFQEVIITSPIGTTALAGYMGLKKHAQGINDQLFANCAVFESNQEMIALVALDLVGLLPATVMNIREKTLDLLDGKIKKENIMIACTHTHSGPDTMGIFKPGHYLEYKPDDEYLDMLARLVAGGILGAYNKLEDARVSIGHDSLFGVSVNRRQGMPPNKLFPRTVDPEVQAIFFESVKDKQLLGMIVNFAAHCTAFPTKATLLISADYVGALRKELKETFKSDPVILYLNGAIGDVSPRGTPISQRTPKILIKIFKDGKRVLIENFVKYARFFKINPGNVSKFYNNIKKSPRFGFIDNDCFFKVMNNGSLSMEFSKPIQKENDLRKLFTWFAFYSLKEPAYVRMGRAIAKKVNSIYRKRKKIKIDIEINLSSRLKPITLDIDDPEMANEGLFEEYIYKGKENKYHYKSEIQAIKIGDFMYILTIPGEALTQTQLRLKYLVRSQVKTPFVFISGVTNGEIGYILTPEEFDMAGYESMICFGRNNAYIIEKGLIKLVSNIENRNLKWKKEFNIQGDSKLENVRFKDVILITHDV
ncbi:MAG: neutral/alkaline non-lysosomal ceramidase N-terminal domain-containing protein [Promethearchaeota archaeon]